MMMKEVKIMVIMIKIYWKMIIQALIAILHLSFLIKIMKNQTPSAREKNRLKLFQIV